MVSRLTITIMFILTGLTAYSQEVSKEDADSLLKSLSKEKSDVERMDIFLQVAEYYIFKPEKIRLILIAPGNICARQRF